VVTNAPIPAPVAAKITPAEPAILRNFLLFI
jgi:hypothetical protein